MNKLPSGINVFRVILGLLLLIFIVFFSEITNVIIRFLVNFSPNKSFTAETMFLIQFGFAMLVALIAVFILLTFNTVTKRINETLIYFIDIQKVKKTFINDGIYDKKWLNWFIIIGGVVASAIPVFVYLFSGMIEQEGTYETAGSFLFLFSSLLLLFSFFRLNLAKYRRKTALIIRGILLGGSILLFLIFGEEISWGQHFFGWESPEVFQEVNFQQETNVHNFFNPIFLYLYPAFGMGLLILLSHVWFFPNNKPFAFELLFPPPSLFFVAVFLAGTSVMIHHEPFEQIFGTFTFLYSMRIAVCSVHLSKETKVVET